MATVTKVIMDKDDLQPLADGIKELEGNTSNITLSQMENAISNTNSEINRQGTLISEIISALEGKSAPGDGGSGSGVETCTVTFTGTKSGNADVNYQALAICYTTISTNGTIVSRNESLPYVSDPIIISNVVRNTLLYVKWRNHANVNYSNATHIMGNTNRDTFLIDAAAGENVLINNNMPTASGGGND